MKIWINDLQEVLEGDVSVGNLRRAIGQADSLAETITLPWQFGAEGKTGVVSLLGVINGVLAATTGMVLTGTIDDVTGELNYWFLRKVWWPQGEEPA